MPRQGNSYASDYELEMWLEVADGEIIDQPGGLFNLTLTGAAVIPEPSMFALLAAAGLTVGSLALLKRRREPIA